MVITLFRVYRFIPGSITLTSLKVTSFLGFFFFRNMICVFLILVEWRLIKVETLCGWYMKKIMHTMLHVTGVYLREIVNTFEAGWVSSRVKNFNVTICLDSRNVKNVKLCMMVLLIKLYLFISLSVSMAIFQGQSSVI